MNHDYNIIHRNISPYTILVDINHNVKLSGFRLSKDNMKYIDGYAYDIVGAIDYRAPEVDKGKYDWKADFFSLCITFYEALTGY